ncbi:MAG: efflux RND transporter periplasmic adaptor subunit [Myxococcota bacterium]
MANGEGRRFNLKLVVPLVLAGVALAVFIKSRFAPHEVTVTPVVRGKAVEAVYATGTVEADDRVNVKAKTSGSMLEIRVKEGDRVKRGDVLARIDNPSATFELTRGKADLSAASQQAGKSAPHLAALEAQAAAIDAERKLARIELERSEALAKSNALTTAELDRARARVSQLDAQIAALSAQQRALRIDLSSSVAQKSALLESLASRVSDTFVRAPLDGVVLGKYVELGEVVALNQTLFKVGDTANLVLEVAVDEADIARVRAAAGNQGSAAAVSLYAFPKQIFSGHVFEVYPDANRERKSFLAKVRLDAPPAELRSGMSAEVNIISSEKDGALLLPSSAEDQGFVWVADQGRARRRRIQVGIRDLLRLEALSGVNAGELVIVSGQDQLSDGTRVSPVRKNPDPFEPMPDKSQPSKAAL